MSGIEDRIRAAEERARRRQELAARESQAGVRSSSSWREVQARLSILRRELAQRFPTRGDAVDAASAPLDRIFLERALSALKHGLVESCFYNLRLLAQKVVLDGKEADLGALREAAGRLPDLRREIASFLDSSTPGGHRIAGLLPRLRHDFDTTLADLERAVCGGFAAAERIPRAIDALLAGIAAEAESLRSRRLSLLSVVRQAVELEQPRLGEARMEVRVVAAVEDDRIHAEEAPLRDAVVELLRNAAIHRLENGPGEVVLSLERAGEQLVLAVASRPARIPAAPLEQLFLLGCSRRKGGGDGLASVREVVRSLGGEAELRFDGELESFEVSLRLPVRLPI